jgi:type IV pilus assembly protein PilX
MNSHTRTHGASRIRTRAQRGVALVVAMILLLVATLIGLAASRDTLLQERMSSNSYDRSLAFQRSEAALRHAEALITSSAAIGTLGGVDCSTAACTIVPTDAFTGTSAAWQDVTATFDVNDALTPGVPQYHIALMGTGSAGAAGQDENAAAGNYDGPIASSTVAYFRATARSSNPTTLGGRAIVVLQSTVKRPL